MKRHSPPIDLRKPHIVLVNVWRVVNAKGGTEKVFCDMANALSKRGYEVTALFCDPNQGEPGFPVENGVRCVNAFKKPLFPFLYKNPWRNLRCWRFSKERRKLLRNTLDSKWRAESIGDAIARLPKVDLFISYQAESTWVLRDCLKIETPIVTMFHSNPLHYFNEQAFEIYRRAVGSSEVLQVLLPEFVSETRDSFPDAKIVTIPNVAPKYDCAADLSKKTIITVARVESGKRTTLLLEAFALLKDRFPDWKCEWYGERTRKRYSTIIDDMVRENGLDGRVLFPGKTNDVPGKLRNASIFAFPSQFEGFGIALAEAFAMGLPAIGCKDCPAVNSLIKDESNGFLTEPTPEAYAEGLAKLMESEELRRQYGAQGREDMKAYSAEAVWGAWDKLIRELIGK